MKGAAGAMLVGVVLAGCGGGGGDPTPQDAEAHVRDVLNTKNGNIRVESVFCEEQQGAQRFICTVKTSILGQVDTRQTLVNFDEIP